MVQDVKKTLSGMQRYIQDNCVVGLVSYSDTAYLDLEPAAFRDGQPLAFALQTQTLASGDGGDARDAMVLALWLASEQVAKNPGISPKIFLLSAGGSNLDAEWIASIAAGLDIPIHTITYEKGGDALLEELAAATSGLTMRANEGDTQYWIRDIINNAWY